MNDDEWTYRYQVFKFGPRWHVLEDGPHGIHAKFESWRAAFNYADWVTWR